MSEVVKKKILLVEDDANLSKILVDKLTELGFDVASAPTGQQAITQASVGKFDLILLDIILPGGMNGFDVLENLKRNPDLKSIPVIVLTNLDSEQKSSLEIGAADYIIKSNISLDDLILKIKNHIL